MGLFDKFKKKSSVGNAECAKIAADIFKTICRGDENAVKEIDVCTSDPRGYAAKNAAQFAERGLSADTDTDTLMWIGCVDILIKNAYAAEFDFKCELEDFIYGLNELDTHAFGDMTFEEDGLDDEEDITVWADALDERLKERRSCIGGVDIDSDSYVVFLTEIETLERLKETANGIGHKIDRAKKL